MSRLFPLVVLWIGSMEWAIAPVTAQPIPDRTLGSESSIVRPGRIRNRDGHRIEGGAIRGDNLFHSFLEFNIDEGNAAYFVNPRGITTILGRVTGDDVSDIFGTLGVLGQADLFLLNPNGFVFGENAVLDIGGSFVATTADQFEFPDGSQFSAVNPNPAPLLTVALSPGLQYGTRYQGAIANSADLSVDAGQTLSLAGTTTTITGSLTAPGGVVHVLGDQLNLLGNAQIDVSAADGGGDIFVGGNQRGMGALPNAQQTFVGPSVTLHADALTNGDGGNIIVWANDLTRFYGALSAQGGTVSGDGGFAEVSGRQRLVFDGQANLGAPQGQLGTLLLDPTNIIIVDGDIGDDDAEIADDNVEAVDSPNETFTISEETLEDIIGNVVLEATNDITVNDLSDNELTFLASDGDITFTADADNDGAGLFTMLDTADVIFTAGRNITISGSKITPGEIDSAGGDITLTAGDRIILDGIEINSGSFDADADGDDEPFVGTSGDITLTASNKIRVTNTIITSDGAGVEIGESNAGDIVFQVTDGSIIVVNGSEISSSADGSGFAGDITLTAGDRINIRNQSNVFSNADGALTGEGGAGDIRIRAENDIVLSDGATINAETVNDTSETIDSGRMTLRSVSGSVILRQASLSTNVEGSGFAGDILLRGGTDVIVRDSAITSDLGEGFTDGELGEGGAGFIELRALNTIILDGRAADPDSNLTTISATSFNGDAAGEAGEVELESRFGSIVLFNSAEIRTNVEASGFAGDVRLLAPNGSISISDSSILSDFQGSSFDDVGDEGGAGFISLLAGDDISINGSITEVDSDGTVFVRRALSASTFGSPGSSDDDNGNILIQSTEGTISIQNARVVAIARGIDADAGSITVQSGGDTILIAGDSRIRTDATGDDAEGGEIRIRAIGNGGQITINNSRVSSLADIEASSENLNAIGGLVDIEAASDLAIINDSRILSDASGIAGVIELDASDTLSIRNSTISSEGTEGNIAIGDTVAPIDIEIVSSSISTANEGTPEDDAGFVLVDGQGALVLDASEISSEAVGEDPSTGDASGSITAQANGDSIAFGNGGNITLIVPQDDGIIILLNGSRVLTDAGAVFGANTGGNGGNIEIEADVVAAEFLGNNDITANSVNNNGGTIEITASTGIFGLIERTREDLIALLGTDVEGDLDPQQVPTSDITAISQEGAGLDGEIVLTTPDVDPSQGTVELPSALEETPTLASVCRAGADAEGGRRSEFVVTGRGGLPTDPDDPVDGSRPTTPWVERHLSGMDGAEDNASTPGISSIVPNSTEVGGIVEAQGWVTTAEGQTVLMASVDAPAAFGNPHRFVPDCLSLSGLSDPES
ncbi:MAG: filamentous hemagglutinin N-terminal domain-containing protein [Cyanobacteria bacterium J06626_14]